MVLCVTRLGNAFAKHIAFELGLLKAIDPTLQPVVSLVDGVCIVICGGGKHVNVTELVVGLVQRIQAVEQRLHLAAHLVIIDRRGEDDDLGFLDLCHDFGYIILQYTTASFLAGHASDAEPDIFAAQGHELNPVTRILRAAFAFLCQNLRIAVSAQAGGNYKNLLCHSFNAPFCSDFCSSNAENLPRQHRAAVRLHDFVDESLDAFLAVLVLSSVHDVIGLNEDYHRPTTDKSDAYISKKKELENLGFDWSCEGRWDWDAKEATWLQNYNGIKAYVDANGCLPIGESAISLTTSVNSEFWIAAQKAAIRNGMMNEDKQQMLASIGIVYGQFKRNDDWQENYNFVKAYYEQHKQLPVGVNSQQMSTGSLSGFWIGLQRKKLKDNALSAERVGLLKEIGIEYGQLENSWNANYNAVKMFFDEHHHLPVHDASILLPSGIQSRNWITNQKKFLKTGTAPEDRVKLLNEIGIVAEADAPKPSKSKSEKVKKAAQTGSKPSRKVSIAIQRNRAKV